MKEKAICRYDKNENFLVFKGVTIGMPQYMENRKAVCNIPIPKYENSSFKHVFPLKHDMVEASARRCGGLLGHIFLWTNTAC